MIVVATDLIERAKAGERSALAALVMSIERPIFNLAMRMLASRPDAEDASQEILIRVVTRLGSLRDPGAAGGWVLRIAVRHLVSWRKRSALERARLSFSGFAADLSEGLMADARDDMETRALADEVRVGCTLALLTCLSRPLRMAYILGAIFELADVEAAGALDISPDAFRQRLKRARAGVEGFMRIHCGLVARHCACSCERRVLVAKEKGRVGASAPAERAHELGRVREEISRLEAAQAAVHVMRRNRDFSSDVARRVLAMLEPAS
jgi:RNA polymerase sigma factor (sigma-70 family)